MSSPALPLDPLPAHPLAQRWLGFTQRMRGADRARPRRLDSLIAAVVALLGLADAFVQDPANPFQRLHGLPLPAVLAIIAGLALPLLWRRRAPGAVFSVVIAVCAVQWSLGVLLHSDLSVLVALYALARYATRPRLPWAAAATVAAATVLVLRVEVISQPLLSLFFVCGTATAAVALGLAVRIRQAHLAAVADRAARLETEREQRVQLAISAERGRVSREMHDIVGHTLAVIIGLADGGAALAGTAPERSGEALRIIAGTGRQALGELRRTLAALRDQPSGPEPAATRPTSAELAPQPGTADLSALLDRTRAAGPEVAFRTTGDIAAPTPGVQLAVYRIVQESLTNALKYAGPTTSLRVTLQVTPDRVHLRVQDSGPGERRAPTEPDRDGLGLIGIRERAVLSGGTATAGPRPGGGWTVAATLPLTPREERP
ncbi:sensor histidine kinase [Streptomyces polygonati]|uniref:histidine kinase n=1 Tax=Streptomyces polygonati TaxID=1617087 RepID=A0ABV8HL82_9ACTN